MKVRYLIEMLQRDYQPDEEVAIHLWNKHDVRSVANDDAEGNPVKLSDEACYAVLEDFEGHCDSTIGLTWDDLEYRVRQYLEENPPDPLVELMDKAKEEADEGQGTG